MRVLNFIGRFAIIGALMALVMLGCKKDKCEGVSCLNGGTCNDGTCACVNGYTGDRCQTAPVVNPPVASFTIDKTTCQAPCTFNASSTSTGATSLSWDYEKVGNATGYATFSSYSAGSTSIEFSSSAEGTFKISLEATNSGGTHTSEKTITLTQPNTDPPCQTNNTATITVYMSNTNNEYEMFIDGSSVGTIQGPGSRQFTFTAGYTTFKVVQLEGYVVSPTIEEDSRSAVACEDYTWTPTL